MKSKKIGIIGGQGPVSTADIYLKIISSLQKNFGAKQIKDYPSILIDSIPTNDLISGLDQKEWLTSEISPSIQLFETFEADFIAIACNTLHAIYDDLSGLTSIPIIHLPNTVVRYISDKDYKCVGILGTNATVQHKLYESHLDNHQIRYIYPDAQEQNKLVELIYQINAGANIDRSILSNIVSHLRVKGADVVILACTELPTILNLYKNHNFEVSLINCNEIYAYEISRLAYEK